MKKILLMSLMCLAALSMSAQKFAPVSYTHLTLPTKA